MTTNRQIVIDAYRDSGLVQVGTTPDADEFDEGFRKLESLVQSLFGFEMGSPLTPMSYGTDGVVQSHLAVEEDYAPFIDFWYVPDNTRLMVNISGPKTVYLPPNPKDGTRVAVNDVSGNFSTNNFTVHGNGRKIEGLASVTLSTDSEIREWFYREDTGNWAVVTTLNENDQQPFPSKFDDLLILKLSMRINPRYQAGMSQEQVADLRRMERMFKAQYSVQEEAETELALQQKNRWYSYPSTARFLIGKV